MPTRLPHFSEHGIIALLLGTARCIVGQQKNGSPSSKLIDVGKSFIYLLYIYIIYYIYIYYIIYFGMLCGLHSVHALEKAATAAPSDQAWTKRRW